MATPPDERKPYTTYRTADAESARETGARHQTPPRGSRSRRLKQRRRQRRALGPTLLLAAAVAAVILVAALWGGSELGSGTGDTTAQTPGAPSVAAYGGSSSPTPSTSPAEPDPSPEPTPTTALSITVTGGGDSMAHGSVRTLLTKSGPGPLADVADVFATGDLGFVNLESPLTTGGEAQTWKDVVLTGDPRFAAALAAGGIDVVTLANNHAGDHGDDGLLDTIEACRKAGVAVVGAGPNLAAAQKAAILRREGARIAFLGFSDVLPEGYAATAAGPGISPGRTDITAAKGAIRAASKKADFTIVGWHWNLEYTTAPSSLEINEGHAAIDAGADIVFGHHPHVVQGVQAYHGGLIFYSLGNLVFSGYTETRAQTVLVTADISDKRIAATLIPVQISSAGKPTVATGADGLSILRRVRDYSSALGTVVKIRGGKGHVDIERGQDQ